MKRRILLSVFVIQLFCFPLWSQQELGLHFIGELPQVQQTNPAMVPGARFFIALPSAANDFYLSNLTFNEVVDDSGEVLDIDAAIELLDTENFLREYLTVETVTLGLGLGRFQLTLGHATRFNAFLRYPKALPQLVWQGNAQFLGEEVAFGPDMQIGGYHEWSAGVAANLIPSLRLGARVKLLSGISDASTARSGLRLLTNEETYALTLDSDFLLNTTGSVQYEGYDRTRFELDFGRESTEQPPHTGTGGPRSRKRRR